MGGMSTSVRQYLAASHVSTLEAARQASGLARPVGARTLFLEGRVPRALQFRLKYFLEHESTDGGLQGASDETFISAVGMDSAAVTVGPDHEPVAELTAGRAVGAPAMVVRDSWRDTPHVLVEFDLRRPGDWPRSYTTTLLLIEHDDGELADGFHRLESEVGEEIKVAAVAAASAAAGAAAGAAIGSVIPGIGTAVGAAVGALAGVAYDEIISAIDEGLSDDVFTPIPITLTAQSAAQLQLVGADADQVVPVREHGAFYEISYDWHLVQ